MEKDFHSFSELEVPSELKLFYDIQMKLGSLSPQSIDETSKYIGQNLNSTLDYLLLVRDVSAISRYRPQAQELYADLLFKIGTFTSNPNNLTKIIAGSAAPQLLVFLFIKGMLSLTDIKHRAVSDSNARFFLQPFVKLDRDWLSNPSFADFMKFYDDLIADDYKEWIEVAKHGVKKGQFGYILKHDLVDQFSARIQSPEDFEKPFKWSPFEVPIEQDLVAFGEAAAFYGSEKIFKCIASQVSDFDKYIKFAVLGGNKTIINMCLSNNKSRAENCLNFAMDSFRFDLFEELQKYNCTPPLTHMACETHNYPVFIYTIRGKFDPNNRINKNAYPLISIACNTNDIHMVEFLISKGANVNVPTNSEFPIHIAASNGNLEIIKALLDSGANPNEENNGKFTPLHLTAISGATNVAEYLLEKGASIDAENDWNQTPLQLAVESSKPEVAKLLINKGANVKVKVNGEGKDSSNKKFTAKNRNLLHFACFINDIQLCQYLLKMGVDVNAEDEYRITPLLIATQNGKSDICKLLISNGAKVNVKDSQMLTPLHLAAQSGNFELVKLLVENGADVKAKGGDGFPIRKAKSDEIKKYLMAKMQGK
ncbi:tankyrase, putative [Trichomonas vaginalis G3]|uniref:Tankyrase, putative n=1 Tax=Trichomonas vaginalis (strain ATCC PRA-98 / G3) TaxID=412133 RepID=A2FMC0_TRIV3|nr:spectrin binding [Trichomonas vaginalis G3]EAX93937.1 tankyrase, putative [Trichomonas vaginalis G3]KAI5549070.1 spectrin binding [Trichomonas vaginalis G3]|eukprot:XP_001306867.1 tankyrase [Trichomonas vaginalis G3]